MTVIPAKPEAEASLRPDLKQKSQNKMEKEKTEGKRERNKDN